MYLIIDERERKFVSKLTKKYMDMDAACSKKEKNSKNNKKNGAVDFVQFEELDMYAIVATIACGDFAFVNETGAILCIFERKTLEDFGASIKDGRVLNEQKMLRARDLENARSDYTCRVFLIIEGKIPSPGVKKYFGGIPWHGIESHIFHAAMRDGIIPIYTKDIADTVSFLNRFYKSLGTLEKTKSKHVEKKDEIKECGGEKSATLETPEILDTIEISDIPESQPQIMGGTETHTLMLTQNIPQNLCLKNIKTVRDIVIMMWSAIPYITATTAISITETTLGDIFRGNIPSILGGVKVKKPTHAALVSIAQYTETDTKTVVKGTKQPKPFILRVLSQIPQITEDSAREILRQIPVRQLPDYSAETLGKVKINKRCIGIKKANSLLCALNHKL